MERTANPPAELRHEDFLRALIVINPVAGDGRSTAVLPELIKRLTEKGCLCTAVTTTGTGSATRFVKLLGAASDVVVCSGGDGTANEVISGLMQIDKAHRPKFAYIPAGSTNDFAVTLGLPKRPKDAMDIIEAGVSVSVDVGMFNERYYAYVCAFGAFTGISHSTSQTAKNIFGQIAYFAKGLEALRSIVPIRARFIINGEQIEDDVAFCSISNSTMIGGVIKLKPALVELNDGMFEIIMIKYPQDAMGFTKIFNAIASGEMSCEYIRIFHAQEVEITILEEDPVDWSLDGEIERGVRRAHIKCIRSGIDVIVGSNGTALKKQSAAEEDKLERSDEQHLNEVLLTAEQYRRYTGKQR